MGVNPADISDKPLDLETILVRGREGILLKASKRTGEIGVLNPSLYQDSKESPWPFVYRTRRKNRWGEYSTIDFRWLENPRELSEESNVLIEPTRSYECAGCEDPRVTLVPDMRCPSAGNIYAITYTAYDGRNPRIGLAVTQDFKTIEKLGMIGPDIPLNIAIDIVGDERYKRVWSKMLGRRRDGGLMLPVKDASLHFNGEWKLILRLEPDMFIVSASNLEQFRDKNYWINFLRNLESHVLIRAEKPFIKVGLGSPPVNILGRRIGIYHGVTSSTSGYRYYGSFFEVDKNYGVVSVLRNPLLRPETKNCMLREFGEKGEEIRKMIVFPTAMLTDPKDKDSLVLYSGIGDREIGYRTTSLKWLCEELDKSRITA